jgi:hypothetical protein
VAVERVAVRAAEARAVVKAGEVRVAARVEAVRAAVAEATASERSLG